MDRRQAQAQLRRYDVRDAKPYSRDDAFRDCAFGHDLHLGDQSGEVVARLTRPRRTLSEYPVLSPDSASEKFVLQNGHSGTFPRQAARPAMAGVPGLRG